MNNIKYYREKRNLSQLAVAEKLSVSQQAVAKWETEESLPRADKLWKLAQIFHCTIDDLLSETKTNKRRTK